MAQTPLNELEQRIVRLEDLEAIRRLKARYLNAVDSQDVDRAAGCFAEGPVVIDMGHVGVFKTRDEFAALYKAAGCHPYILDMHHGANPEIDFESATLARAVWALEYRNLNTRDQTVTFISLQYHDEYQKRGDTWWITKSRSEFKTALHCSYADGALRALLAAKSVAGTVEYPAPPAR